MSAAATRMKIAVVGAGAIGSYYGAKLAHAGSDVHFLLRGDFDHVREHGIHVRGRRDENFHVQRVQCYRDTRDIGESDVVLIALKATSNDALLELLPPLIGEGTVLLTLQNGLGNEEFLARNFGAERVAGGLCFVCLNRVAPGMIDHYDIGRVAIGEFCRPPMERTRRIAGEFTRAGVRCDVVDDLVLERWRKLVWNVPFNGLAVTAGGADTSVILRHRDLRDDALTLMREVIAAANACGFRLSESEAETQMKRTEKLGDYKPSTLVDYEAGRPLEVEAIWGEPLRRAVAAGCETPMLKVLHAILQRLSR